MILAAQIAKKYIGKREKPNNSGFLDIDFEHKMSLCGWQKGQAWCAYFAELVWKEAFPDMFSILDSLFSSGAVSTWNKFMPSNKFVCDKEPAIGAVVIWQKYHNGVPHWTGHAGIVESFEPAIFTSIEGNSNSFGGREGFEVSRNSKRTYNFAPRNEGLVLLGFIKIKDNETNK